MSTPFTPSERHSKTGVSKVEQYKWKPLDKPGELKYLPKSALYVDHRYQRQATKPRVLKIASELTWAAFGVLLVAKRPGDARLYVFEGQHRYLAAMLRSDVTNVPCIVFDSTDIQEEAEAFLKANTGRRMPTALEKWRAAIVCKDELIVYCDTLIRTIGRVPASQTGPSQVRCLSALVAAAKRNRSALESVWPLVAELVRGKPFHERIFEGLLYIEEHLPNGESLSDKRWRDRLERVGAEKLLDGANRGAAFFSKGGAKSWATGILETLNKGCRIQIVLQSSEISPSQGA